MMGRAPLYATLLSLAMRILQNFMLGLRLLRQQL